MGYCVAETMWLQEDMWGRTLTDELCLPWAQEYGLDISAPSTSISYLGTSYTEGKKNGGREKVTGDFHIGREQSSL